MIVDEVEVKAIPGFPNYAISQDGRVWSFPRQGSSKLGMWRKLVKQRKGYYRVMLHERSVPYVRLIHRLVLETYVGPCPEGMECRHLNGNPADNRLENLCWGTQTENQQDRFLHGTDSQGEKCGGSKLTLQKVRQIIYEYRTGLFSHKELANQFDISRTTVCQIMNKKRWGHIWATL